MGVASLDPETGELFWEEPFTGPGGTTIANAVQSGSCLLVSGFYTGSMMLRLNVGEAEWRDTVARFIADEDETK